MCAEGFKNFPSCYPLRLLNPRDGESESPVLRPSFGGFLPRAGCVESQEGACFLWVHHHHPHGEASVGPSASPWEVWFPHHPQAGLLWIRGPHLQAILPLPGLELCSGSPAWNVHTPCTPAPPGPAPALGVRKVHTVAVTQVLHPAPQALILCQAWVSGACLHHSWVGAGQSFAGMRVKVPVARPQGTGARSYHAPGWGKDRTLGDGKAHSDLACLLA